ncbi:MAG TPA: hypothetical protein VL651_01405 [Bacteroidia bacterium]|jgi:hypothetical protein|nr:hypothetical protein [Bacteroidia bacterium]
MRNSTLVILSTLLLSFSGGDPDLYKKQIVSHFTDWFAYNKKNKTGFSISYFSKKKTEAYSYEFDFPLENEEVDSVQSKMYYWSPDSSYYLDIYSYAYWFSVDSGRVYLSGQEPECAVFLYSPWEKKGYRMTFGGSESDFEDAAWFSKSCFAVAGSEITGSNFDSVYNFVEVFDLGRNTKTWYEGAPYKRDKKRASYVQQKAEKVLLGK